MQKLFKKNSIAIGDRIKIKARGLEVEGELMPKTEVSADNVIILKLANGYNIGIAHDNALLLSKISGGSEGIEFPKAEAGVKPGLPKVTLIYTGGTIGSKIDYKTGGVYMLIKPEELLYEVPELSDIANIEVKQLFSIASEDMTSFEWAAIAREVKSAFDRGSSGVVVTMGTDIMHYTASALAFMLCDLNGPVVVTGAQRSSDRGSSDAFFNLIASVTIAAHSDIAEVGICMHSSSSDERCSFIRGTRARKMHTSRRDAFRPVNDRPIAYVERSLKITYNNDYNKTIGEIDQPVSAKTNFERKVALIKYHPNSDPEVLEHYIKKDYKGIIIEGTGLGHVSVSQPNKNATPWVGAIKRAVDNGIIVGMTSQCLYGRVSKNVYRNLRIINSLGVIYCEDMTPETAYVKLAWLLGNYNAEECKRLLDSSIAREIKKRSRYDEFLL
jgi:glutamyl-tRNA(Gln) amidotransferase subunit D